MLGGSDRLGARSGRQWFHRAYELAKTDHPEMMEEEFRSALLSAERWQEDARGQVAYQVNAAIYQALVAKNDEWSAAHIELIRIGVFGSGGAAPTEEEGLGAAVPKIVKLDDPGETEMPAAHLSSGDRVPGAVRGEVKHRVKNGSEEGTIPYQGSTYAFNYRRKEREIWVHGGVDSEVIPYTPRWLR